MKYPPMLCTGGYFGLQAKSRAITDYGKTDAPSGASVLP